MLKPLKDNVLLKPVADERKSSIVLTTEEESTRGEVLGIGSEVKEVEKGDVVYFRKYAPIKIDDLLLVSEDDILGIL